MRSAVARERRLRAVRALFAIERGERVALAWAAGYFFCLLCSYYVLRPLRDEMGIQGGVRNLPWLFTGTLAAMLCAVPLFGALAARLPRRRLLPAVYGFFIANLAVFFALFASGSGAEWSARAFFIWVSVFNLFVVSVFWSFMVDVFSAQQGKRLFGLIAGGGSAGALAGPALTATAAPVLGTANLLAVSAAFLLLAIGCVGRLAAWADRQPPRTRNAAADARREAREPIGGGAWAGVACVARSGYLAGIAGYVVLYTVLSTFLYLQQARIVADAISDPAQRTALFASMDLAVNAASLAGQILLAQAMLRRFGVAAALALVPALTVAGFLALGTWPTLAVVVAFQIARRAGDFAITRPARELLFAVVGREAKYKAKNFIDTVVFRCGDALGGWLFAGLGSIGLGVSAIALGAVPVAAAWLALGVGMGRRHARMQRLREDAQ